MRILALFISEKPSTKAKSWENLTTLIPMLIPDLNKEIDQKCGSEAKKMMHEWQEVLNGCGETRVTQHAVMQAAFTIATYLNSLPKARKK